MKSLFNRFVHEENGATAIEYSLIAALVAIAIIGSIGLVGDAIVAVFTGNDNSVGTAIDGALPD